MPITQDRMLDLIAAGRAFKEAYTDLNGAIVHTATLVAAGRLTPEEALTQLESISTVSVPGIHYETLTREAYHFKHTSARNASAKRRMETKRRRLGIQPLQTSEEKLYADFNRGPAAEQGPASPDFSVYAKETSATKPPAAFQTPQNLVSTLRPGEVHETSEVSIEASPDTMSPEDLADGLL